MRYFYEYKEKDYGIIVGGHNLEEIKMTDEHIVLSGVDIINENYHYWSIFLDTKNIEYLSIRPMEDEII